MDIPVGCAIFSFPPFFQEAFRLYEQKFAEDRDGSYRGRSTGEISGRVEQLKRTIPYRIHGKWYILPTNLPEKSTIHVGKYTIFPWILWATSFFCFCFLVDLYKVGSRIGSIHGFGGSIYAKLQFFLSFHGKHLSGWGASAWGCWLIYKYMCICRHMGGESYDVVLSSPGYNRSLGVIVAC